MCCNICKCKLPVGLIPCTSAPRTNRSLVLHSFLTMVRSDLACRGAAQPVGGYILYRDGRGHPCDMRVLRECINGLANGNCRHGQRAGN